MAIRIRFTQDAGFTPWIIRSYTWSDIDHCEFALPYGYLGARTDGKGVAVRPFDYKGPVREQFASIECDPAVERRVLDFAKQQLGKPYDYSAIAGIALHRDWRNAKQWICSELIAAAFEQAGMPLLNADNVNRLSPRDIMLTPYLKLESPRLLSVKSA